ncbi:hypothetical protein NPIL_21881 [Nephila pilipes]|uniref:Uncharacterized protein n=1 Tax=Nephila pilipes TaxID=299642 RepID=A0A8X6P858_NEPPI|nr:hypothetical protein NPIL_560821 [Nephila pilipes]GFT66678.1 hypothetical protein NPIL_21881 [Nephila pilipes]
MRLTSFMNGGRARTLSQNCHVPPNANNPSAERSLNRISFRLALEEARVHGSCQCHFQPQNQNRFRYQLQTSEHITLRVPLPEEPPTLLDKSFDSYS